MNLRHFRKSHWVFSIMQLLTHPEYRFIFRKIYLHNRKGVPADKPVLIAANHPTAFIDPVFFCIFFEPPVYNMTRGDIFRKPLFRKMLESLNMFPVYRRRDGYDQRDRNDEVFEFCQKKLLEGVAVNIFVEGEHHLDKRVLPLQKGLARIAFGTYEKHHLEDLQVIPVGCNYVTGHTLRDEAKIIVGEPIFIRNYWEKYQQNPGSAITELCSDIRKALISLAYHVEDRSDDELVDQMLTVWRNDHPDTMIPIVKHHAERFFQEKEIIGRINTLEAGEKERLKKQASDYFDGLKAAGADDESLVQEAQGSSLWIVFFILGFIPMALGSLIDWPGRTLSLKIAREKVKKPEFYTSVIYGVHFIVNIILYILLTLLALIFRQPWFISAAILLPVLTWFSIFWKERLSHWLAVRKAQRLTDRARLLEMRQALSRFTR